MDPTWTASEAAPKDARPYYPEPSSLGRLPSARRGMARTMVIAGALVGVTAIALAVAMIGKPPAKSASSSSAPAGTSTTPIQLSSLPPTGAGPVDSSGSGSATASTAPGAGPSPKPVPYPAYGTAAAASPGRASTDTRVAQAPRSSRATDSTPSARHAVPVATRAAATDREVCLSCGTVVSVHAVTVSAPTTGVGAVGGGAAGALVGSQVAGRGDRTLGAFLGALGGGFIGHQVEKQARKTTVYDVRVHMEDGSYRTLRQSTPWKVGAKVNVTGQKMRAMDGET